MHMGLVTRHLPMLVRLLPLVFALVGLLIWTPRSDAAFPGENGKLAYSVLDVTGEVETDRVCSNDPNGANRSCFAIGSTDDPAWSPSGTRLAVSDLGDIYTVNPDGSGQTPLTSTGTDVVPAWSPDGAKIAFSSFRDGNWEIYVMNADGTSPTRLTNDPADDFVPNWSPDGAWIAFYSSREGNYEIYKMRPDGSGVTRLTNAGAQDTLPNWSPDGAWITFDSDRDGNFEIYKMRANGTDVTRLTSDAASDRHPVWSPDGTKIAFSSSDGRSVSAVAPDGSGRSVLFNVSSAGGIDDRIASGPDWQPIHRGYVRPKGATPTRVSLVPAYKQCTSPNRTHGAPLAFPSCNPPVTESSKVFIGIGDGTPPAAKSIGSVTVGTLVGAPGAPDDADVKLAVNITNVMNRSDSSDYTGELRLELPLRITDRFNTPSPSGFGPATVSDTSIFATVPCAGTADTTIGANCSLSATADALVPGTVREGARSIWALDELRLHDGGPDGDAETPGDNELFATQGVFVP
jgi:Domain of unknown function (DUF5050)